MLAEHLTEVAMVVLAEVVSRVLLAVAVFVQFAYDVPAQVPAAARDRDGHHRAPSGGPQDEPMDFETGSPPDKAVDLIEAAGAHRCCRQWSRRRRG